MKRYTPATLGGWSYTRALYLYGQYLVYKRTGEKKYFRLHQGVGRPVRAERRQHQQRLHQPGLDARGHAPADPAPGNGPVQVQEGADQIRAKSTACPRTSDGGMFHATSKVGRLRADGVYMAQPFIATYAKQYNETNGYDEAARNLVTYFEHPKAPNGLLWHAYDEDGSESWAHNPGQALRRALGAGDRLVRHGRDRHPRSPARQPPEARGPDRDRPAPGRRLRAVPGLGDRTLVPDRRQGHGLPEPDRNLGVVDVHVHAVARRRARLSGPELPGGGREGYQGVPAMASVGSDGLTNIEDISEGTNVGDAAYCFGRPRNTNDFHGLGGFLIMNEQLARATG
jgi:unsaturated rhamnogalacturonyl hydrolase